MLAADLMAGEEVKWSVRLPLELAQAIDAARRIEPDLPSRGLLIRRLLTEALAARAKRAATKLKPKEES